MLLCIMGILNPSYITWGYFWALILEDWKFGPRKGAFGIPHYYPNGCVLSISVDFLTQNGLKIPPPPPLW